MKFWTVGRSVTFLIGILLLNPAGASATDYPPTSLKERVARADLIVVGRMMAVENVKSRGTKRGKLRVSDVIRGNATAGDELLTGWFGGVIIDRPNGMRTEIPAGITCKPGDKGIWILNKNKADGLYHIIHPGNKALGLKQEKEIRLLAAQSIRPGEDFILNGLRATLSIGEKPFRFGQPISIRVTLTNRSPQTILLSDTANPYERFQLQLTGPDGKPVPALTMKLKPGKFISIPLLPGASYVRTVDISSLRNLLTVPGEYTLTAGYTGLREGPSWKGTVWTKPVHFTLEAPRPRMPKKIKMEVLAGFKYVHTARHKKGNPLPPLITQLRVKLTNDSPTAFALTVETVFLLHGKQVYALHRNALVGLLPDLFKPGKTGTFQLTHRNGPNDLALAYPLRCGIILSDYKGEKYVVLSSPEEIRLEK